MALLRIEHLTAYTYQRPVSFGRHRLVLRPREGHDLRVERMTLDISPAHRLTWARDVYSNSVAIVDFQEAADRLEVRSDVIVECTNGALLDEPREPRRFVMPVQYGELEGPIANVYQTASYPDDWSEIDTWLQQFRGTEGGEDAEALLSTMCRRIAEQIRYQRRHVKGVQTPAETLRLGSGSCRDMATLLMDAARALGLAARFASGYLDCRASAAGHAAMHAWTEIYLPIVGWQGFDPTLGERVSRKHIVAGVSHHPRGVMPISGMFSGASSDYVDMAVQVKLNRVETAI